VASSFNGNQNPFIAQKRPFMQKNWALVGSMFCKLLKNATFASLKQKQEDGCERTFDLQPTT
jgi:hypothetical protein